MFWLLQFEVTILDIPAVQNQVELQILVDTVTDATLPNEGHSYASTSVKIVEPLVSATGLLFSPSIAFNAGAQVSAWIDLPFSLTFERYLHFDHFRSCLQQLFHCRRGHLRPHSTSQYRYRAVIT
jgi:hypothetical protein